MANVLSEVCLSFSWRDAKGQVRKITLCYAADNANLGANSASILTVHGNVVTALQNMSNAHVQSASNIYGGGAAQGGVTYGSTGNYQSVSQQARLYYLTMAPSGGSPNIATVTIPAPLAHGSDLGFGIFEADLVTVAPTNSLVVALNTAMRVGLEITDSAAVVNRAGLQLNTFVGGALVGKKLSRKWSKFTKDPTLTIAGI